MKRGATKKWRKAYYERRMTEYHAYLGGRCVKCGSTEKLEMDHMDPKTKCFTVGAKYDAKWEVIKPELDKCQLLCEACHIDRHAPKQHGTMSMHRYCKCDLCRAVWLEYHRKRRTRLRKAGVAQR